MGHIDSILCITATKFSKGAFVDETVTMHNDLISSPWDHISDVEPPRALEGGGYEEVDFVAKNDFWTFRFDHSCDGVLTSEHHCCHTLSAGWGVFVDNLPEMEAMAERAIVSVDPSSARMWDGDVSVRLMCTVYAGMATSPDGTMYPSLAIRDYFNLSSTLIASSLDKELGLIQSMCGAPDPAEACRQIIRHCDVLKTKREPGRKGLIH